MSYQRSILNDESTTDDNDTFDYVAPINWLAEQVPTNGSMRNKSDINQPMPPVSGG